MNKNIETWEVRVDNSGKRESANLAVEMAILEIKDLRAYIAELEARTPAATEDIARAIFYTFRPANMTEADWDSGAVLGRDNADRNKYLSAAKAVQSLCTPAAPVVAEGLTLPGLQEMCALKAGLLAAQDCKSMEQIDALAAKIAGQFARPSDDALWDATLRDRDTYHDWADKLAEAIAEHFDAEIGEHSNMNCPWAEALEVIEAAHPVAGSPAEAEPDGEVSKMVRGMRINVAEAEPMPASEAPTPELVRDCVQYLKTRFLGWRTPHVDLPADSVIEAVILYTLKAAQRTAAPVPASEAATRLVCLEAAQKLRTYVGIYPGDKQARRLIDELSNIAAPAAPTDAKADSPSDNDLLVFFNERDFYPDNLGDPTRFYGVVRELIANGPDAQSVRDALEQAADLIATLPCQMPPGWDSVYRSVFNQGADNIRMAGSAAIRALIQSPQPGEA